MRVLHSFEDAEPFRDAWDDLVVRSGADIYQTFDWCRIWWRHYGTGRQLHLLLCYSGAELVGVIPGFIEILWLGAARLRVAKLVGADYTLHLCNLPVLPESLQQFVSKSLHHFLGSHHCDLLLMGPLSGPSARFDELLAAGKDESELVQSTELLGNSCNTYFQLPGSFDAYLKTIGERQRGNFKRSVAQFSKLHRVTSDVISRPSELPAEFESFRVLHEGQWRAEGKLGHFRDWPAAERFNADLVQTLGARGMVRFHRILADDQVVSSQFSFAFNGTNYWRLPARVCNAELDRLSLGRMGLAKMIEASIGEGHHTIEGGRGHYAYKLQMGGSEWPLRKVQFMRRGVGVSARVRLFTASASLLNLAYYKVLFMRVAPRFRPLQRPLWARWVRSLW